MEIEVIEAGGIIELLGAVAALAVGWVANRYVIPFLQVGRRRQYATLIATLADELTDDLRETYPDRAWLDHLDEAVDRLIDILGISGEVARRAIRAAASRKRSRADAPTGSR
jgi:hypothetical protein